MGKRKDRKLRQWCLKLVFDQTGVHSAEKIRLADKIEQYVKHGKKGGV